MAFVLNGCANKPKLKLTDDAKITKEINKLLVISYKEKSNSSVFFFDLKKGEKIFERNFRDSVNSYLSFSKTFSSALKKSSLFEYVADYGSAAVWKTPLDSRFIAANNDGIFFFDPDRRKSYLNGSEIKLPEEFVQIALEGTKKRGIFPWINKFVLIGNKIVLVRSSFRDVKYPMKIELYIYNTTSGLFESVSLDLEFDEFGTSNSKDLIYLTRNCDLYKYNIKNQDMTFFLKLDEVSMACLNVNPIDEVRFFYIAHYDGISGHMQKLIFYDAKKSKREVLASLKAEYGQEAEISYSLINF